MQQQAKNRLYHTPTGYHRWPTPVASRGGTPRDDWQRNALVALLWLGIFAGLMALIAFAAGGCAATEVDRQIADAQAQSRLHVAQATTRAAEQVAQVKAKGKVNDANGAAAPVAHPFASATRTVKQERRPLEVAAPVAFILFLASIGLCFTPLSVISKVAVPVTGAVAIGSFAGLIVLPFLPWLFFAAGAGATGLFVYEWARSKSAKPAAGASTAQPAAPAGGGAGALSSSIAAAARNELATLEKSVLDIAGTKAAPIVTSLIAPAAQHVPVPAPAA